MQVAAGQLYEQPDAWTKKVILNVGSSGKRGKRARLANDFANTLSTIERAAARACAHGLLGFVSVCRRSSID